MFSSLLVASFFFFNDTATTEIYTLSLHDALPISCREVWRRGDEGQGSRRPAHWRSDGRRLSPLPRRADAGARLHRAHAGRSEEHTSELQSRLHLVCRLLLEKKKKTTVIHASRRKC